MSCTTCISEVLCRTFQQKRDFSSRVFQGFSHTLHGALISLSHWVRMPWVGNTAGALENIQKQRKGLQQQYGTAWNGFMTLLVSVPAGWVPTQRGAPDFKRDNFKLQMRTVRIKFNELSRGLSQAKRAYCTRGIALDFDQRVLNNHMSGIMMYESVSDVNHMYKNNQKQHSKVCFYSSRYTVRYNIYYYFKHFTCKWQNPSLALDTTCEAANHSRTKTEAKPSLQLDYNILRLSYGFNWIHMETRCTSVPSVL